MNFVLRAWTTWIGDLSGFVLPGLFDIKGVAPQRLPNGCDCIGWVADYEYKERSSLSARTDDSNALTRYVS